MYIDFAQEKKDITPHINKITCHNGNHLALDFIYIASIIIIIIIPKHGE